MDERRPGYYAVIPASVRYDDQLKPNAKLLYGEISALIGADGFCFAGNSYFSKLYGLTERTVSDLISKLQQRDYIRLEFERDTSGQILSRKIYLKESAPDGQPLEEIFHTPRKNLPEGIEKNFQYTDLSISNKKKVKKEKPKPLTEEEMHPLFVDWITSVAQPDWSRDLKNNLFSLLVSFYASDRVVKKGSPPVRSRRGFSCVGNNLKAWSNGDPLIMQTILNTAIGNGWSGIHPPGGQAALIPPQQSEGRDKEWL